MPRRPRYAPGGLVYHVLNGAMARQTIFEKDADYAAFEAVLHEAMAKHPTRLLAYQVMPNHWHMVLWPREDGELTAFLRWLTHTHVMRWHAQHHTSGTGHLYQGRFKSFPIQRNDYYYTGIRYVERNALRAGLVERAEDWRWSSLWRRVHGNAEAKQLLHRWPLLELTDWVKLVNRPQTKAELAAVRRGPPSARRNGRRARQSGWDYNGRCGRGGVRGSRRNGEKRATSALSSPLFSPRFHD